MKVIKILFVGFILSIFIHSSVIGQKNTDSIEIKVNDLAEIHLNNGSYFYGKVQYYNPLDSLVFLNSQGRTISLPSKVVKKVKETLIVEGAKENKVTVEKDNYGFFDKDWYIDFSAYLLTKKEYAAGGIQLSAGKRYNRWLSVGGFIARDNYNPQMNEVLYPVGVELSGFFIDQDFTPFYKLNMGYGFMFNDDEVFRRESRGGFMINPAVGMRFTGSKYMNGYLSIGYRFQPALTESDIGFRDFETRIRDIYYRRLTLRVGIML